MSVVAEIIPWMAILGFFGLIMKLRVSGDPALWKRIEDLEKRMDSQAKEFQQKLDDERADCARKLAAMEGRIRELQQQQASLGHLNEAPLAGPLHHAFPLDRGPDKDADLVARLTSQPGRRRRAKR